MITNAPLLVSASAGTGKTYWIVQQIVELLVEQGVSLDQVGVITFTEAAAAEVPGTAHPRKPRQVNMPACTFRRREPDRIRAIRI